jgi:hypothetical protein
MRRYFLLLLIVSAFAEASTFAKASAFAKATADKTVDKTADKPLARWSLRRSTSWCGAGSTTWLERTRRAFARHPNWWNDDPDPAPAEGARPGAKSVTAGARTSCDASPCGSRTVGAG